MNVAHAGHSFRCFEMPWRQQKAYARRGAKFDWLSRQLAGLAEFHDAIKLIKPTTSAITNNYESGEFVSSSITLESSLKTAKPNGNGDRESQHGRRNAPSRVVPNKGFKQESILSFQDINIQSPQGWFTFILSGNKDGRERIIVHRFKLDELRVEEIQDLEVRLESTESVTKILEEVNKRVLLDGTDNYESGGYVLLSITAESILKTAKPNGHGYRESWHESRNAPSELAPNKGSMQESILSIQDIDIQSRVLISKDDREMIIVFRFKFEELHIERIQDLQFSF
ncbi:hypothetical protein SASPL_129903 [Salvia splendens]|uniref:Uncharacterized protein n=1 Tax=Salvia splendens TaxID=180675 RepID=A0A8X8XFV2_SALSN|nr:hypothetical protein SASPL_129903 [Salvia splendens]